MLKNAAVSFFMMTLILLITSKTAAFVPTQKPVTVDHDIFTLQINRIWTIDKIKERNPQNGKFILMDVKIINNNWSAEQKTYEFFDDNFLSVMNGSETIPNAGYMGDVKDNNLTPFSVYPGTHNPLDGHQPVTLSEEAEFTLVYDLAADNYKLEIKFLSPLSNTKKSFELWINTDPGTSDYRFALASLEGVSFTKLENWEVVDENFESIIDIEHVTVENCNGIAPLKVSRSLTSTVTTETIVASGYAVELDLSMNSTIPRLVSYIVPVPNGAIKALIDSVATSSGEIFNFNAGTQQTERSQPANEETLEFTISGEIEAPPGTIANYEFIWYRVSRNGKVDLLISDEHFEVLFSIGKTIRGDIKSLPPTPCEDQ